jgi:hypothetical protein
MAATIFFVAVIVFAAGIVAGVMLVVRAGIKREDRNFSLAREAPDRLSRATRRLTGVYALNVQTNLAPNRQKALV